MVAGWRFGRVPTAATTSVQARIASMVSEHQSAAATAAHGDDLGGVTRSRDRESIYTDDGRSGRSSIPSSFDGGSGDGICKNQQSERQFDGISGRWSFLEEAGFKNQQAGSRSHGNHWRGAAMQVDDGKIVGLQLFDEMPKRQVSNHNFSAKSSSLRLHDRQVFDEIPKRSQPHWDLLKCVIDHRIAVKSRPSCVRGAVIDECNRVEQWLRVKSQLQDSLSRRAELVLWSYEIRKQTTALDTACRSLMKAVRKVDVDDSNEADSSEEDEGVVHDVLEMQDEFNPILDGNEDTRNGELINDEPGDTIVTEFEKPSTCKNKVLATSLPALQGATIKGLPLIQIASEGRVQGQLDHEGIDPSRELYNMPSNPEYYVEESIGASANKDKELEMYIMAQDPYVVVNWAKALASADFILVALSLTSTSKVLNDEIFAKVKEGIMIVKNGTRAGEFDVTAVNAPTIYAVKKIVEEDVSGGNTLVLAGWGQFSNKEAKLTRKKMVWVFDPGGGVVISERHLVNVVVVPILKTQ